MKVLVVEDDLISRKKIQFLIRNLGYEVLLASNGEEGYDLWKKELPRIVITDWVMPKMDGVELCNKIRGAGASQYTYLIFVTTKNNSEDMIIGLEAGADDFISKPFNKHELALRIQAGKRVLELESRDIIIMAISKLAESRDSDTGQHIERIRHYSKTLAEELATYDKYKDVIDEIFIQNIFMSSVLHDIGKMGIPDAVLLKPGKLTVEEFEIMKTHARIGYETLHAAAKSGFQANYFVMSAEIALSHHEKYNGTGYPQGLAGSEIPLSARIVSLADVYDALVNKRIYKDAFSHEEAKKEILAGSGLSFDPDIVQAFLDCEHMFIDIHRKMSD